MIVRQHTPLIFIDQGMPARTLPPLPLQTKEAGGYDEAWLRDLAFQHPDAIPVNEIDPSFGRLVPVCTELNTRVAGPADALFINSLGMPTLVECKLWRNPEARREVVGQILDYARVLRRWTYNDLQRETARALKRQGFNLAEHVRDHGYADLDEAAFVDNVTRNLAAGRILLLILGDGIREGVEAIADYIQGTTGLHFTFGLVDTRVYDAGGGRLVVQPRVLAKTLIVNRSVISLSDPRMKLDEPDIEADEQRSDRPRTARQGGFAADFWADVFKDLDLDDAEQRLPKPSNENPIIKLPTGDVWLRCCLRQSHNQGEIYLGGKVNRSQAAVEILERLNADRVAVLEEIGLPPESIEAEGIGATMSVDDIQNPIDRERLVAWFRSSINAFVNAIKPRVTQVAADLGASERV